MTEKKKLTEITRLKELIPRLSEELSTVNIIIPVFITDENYSSFSLQKRDEDFWLVEFDSTKRSFFLKNKELEVNSLIEETLIDFDESLYWFQPQLKDLIAVIETVEFINLNESLTGRYRRIYERKIVNKLNSTLLDLATLIYNTEELKAIESKIDYIFKEPTLGFSSLCPVPEEIVKEKTEAAEKFLNEMLNPD